MHQTPVVQTVQHLAQLGWIRVDAENHNLSQANYVCLSTSAASSILPLWRKYLDWDRGHSYVSVNSYCHVGSRPKEQGRL